MPSESRTYKPYLTKTNVYIYIYLHEISLAKYWRLGLKLHYIYIYITKNVFSSVYSSLEDLEVAWSYMTSHKENEKNDSDCGTAVL